MKKHSPTFPLNLVRSLCGPRVAGALLAGLMVTVASAGTIGISDGKLIVGTEPGDGSQSITASIAGTDLLISGADFDIVTPGCSGLGPVTCALSGFKELIILGGDGDDAISLGAITTVPPFDILILGGPGADVLVGSGGADTIFGGPGDDILIGGPGLDCLSPGPGADVVIQLTASCSSGPDPVITPLPRTAAAVPEPGGLLLLGTGIGALLVTRRKLAPARRG